MQISVKVYPNSKETRIVKGTVAGLCAYVNKPALEGRANNAVRGLLAEYYGVKKYRVRLVRGQKSKIKLFEIDIKK